MRGALLAGAAQAGHDARDGGVYGHVDGPRFNTPTEIAQLAACGVTAVSQTGGPETVLCGELELPYALIGFVTDYANEVIPGEPTPVATLGQLMASSTAVFASVLEVAVPAAGRRAGGRPRARCSALAPAVTPRVLLMAAPAAAGSRSPAVEAELAARARVWARGGRARGGPRRVGAAPGRASPRCFAAGDGPVLARLARARPLAARARRRGARRPRRRL